MREARNCDGCVCGDVDRRTFVSQAALAAAAVVLAACGDKEFLAGPPRLNATIKVGDFPALADVNGAAAIVLDDKPIAIVRTGATTFLALSRTCPHQSGLIVRSSSGWVCTGHGAQFSLRGDWTGGQTTWDMQRWPTSYNATTDILTIGP